MTASPPLKSSFQRTTAVVTGASSGIGRAIALALAEAGVHDLVVHYRGNRAGAEETSEQLQQYGCSPHLIAADLAQSSDRQRLIDESFQRLGSVQSWINNAGADVLTGEQANLNFQDKLQHLIDVDVKGTILLSRLAGQRLREQFQSSSDQMVPSMTMIGWDQAPRGMEGDAGQMFGPTKAAVMAFSASLAQSLAPHVRVNTIAPGWIQTAWGESTSPYWDRRARQQSLMQRWGNPGDVARAALFLADPANDFMTGQTIEVNGGWNRKPLE